MSNTYRHKKACRAIRNKDLPPNIFLGSGIRSDNTRKRDANLKRDLRRRDKARGQKEFLKTLTEEV